MKLSRESQYGLTGVLYLAGTTEGSVHSTREVAAATGLAFPFLAKMFNRLARGGILTAHRGRSRGYALARPAAELSVRAVIEAIEGPRLFRHCLFWSDVCSDDRPCIMHALWARVRPRLEELMETTSITDLAAMQTGARAPNALFNVVAPGPA